MKLFGIQTYNITVGTPKYVLPIDSVRIKKEHKFHYLLRVTTDERIWYTQNKVHSNNKILAKLFRQTQNYQRKIDELLCILKDSEC